MSRALDAVISWLAAKVGRQERRRRPASVEEVVTELVTLIGFERKEEPTDEFETFRYRFLSAIGLHVLVRQASREALLSDAPAVFTRRMIADLPDGLDHLDFEWMLRQSIQKSCDAYRDLLTSDSDAAIVVRREFLDDFRDIYGRFRDVVLEMSGYLEIVDESNFDTEGYFLTNPDVKAAAKGVDSFAREHFRKYGHAEGRRQRVFPERAQHPNTHLPVRFEGPLQVGYAEGATIPAGVRLPTATAPIVEVIAPAERLDARAAYDPDTSSGDDLPRFRQLAAELEWTSPALTLAKFDDAVVNLENGFLICGDYLWSDSCFSTLLCPGGNSRSLDMVGSGGEYFRIVEDDIDEPTSIDGVAMVLCSWASRVNYGHWLMNSLLSVHLVLDRLRSGELELVCPPLTDRQRADLSMLGVPVGAIVETRSRYVRGRIVYPSPLTTQSNMAPGTWARNFFRDLIDRASFGSIETPPRLVYVSRSGLKQSGRIMTNEEALMERLKELGFSCLKPHELDFSEQIRMMSRVEVVIGQFGAALWNVSFVPPGGVVVEICTDSYVSNEYLYLAELKGLRFIRVMTSIDMDPQEAARGCSFSFDAPIDTIEEIVTDLLTGSESRPRHSTLPTSSRRC